MRGTPNAEDGIGDVDDRGEEEGGGGADVGVTAYRMRKVHPTLQLTGVVCLGAAVCVKGLRHRRLQSRAGGEVWLRNVGMGGELERGR